MTCLSEKDALTTRGASRGRAMPEMCHDMRHEEACCSFRVAVHAISVHHDLSVASVMRHLSQKRFLCSRCHDLSTQQRRIERDACHEVTAFM